MRALIRHVLTAAVAVLGAATAHAQAPAPGAREPIIDMHLHAYRLEQGETRWPFHRMCVNDARPCGNGPSTYSSRRDYLLEGTLDMMRKRGVVLGYLSGDLTELAHWHDVGGTRFFPSAQLWDGVTLGPSELRAALAAGRVLGVGEIGAQYDGIPPNDARLEPYFALAESLDVPVLIHTAGLGSREPAFRSGNGHPLLLEEVLARHPHLRLYVENAGYPFLDEMIALLVQHPALYVDVSTITWLVPREAFHDYLRALVRAGFGKRIMFGSDQLYWPEVIGEAIDAVQSAPFLTHAQQRDILYHNAARFLRLGTVPSS